MLIFSLITFSSSLIYFDYLPARIAPLDIFLRLKVEESSALFTGLASICWWPIMLFWRRLVFTDDPPMSVKV